VPNERSEGRIPAVRVRQWSRTWDSIDFDSKAHRRRPPNHFYIFSMAARDLKALTGIRRREVSAGKPRADDLGIQRIHDPARSNEIREFVRFGYPWSELSERKRKRPEYEGLKKPGWLPTAVVVNIVTPLDSRGTQEDVHVNDLLHVIDEEQGSEIVLPDGFSGPSWTPAAGFPIEVIDGQHRLWAFERDGGKTPLPDDYQLPVVAFVGLDISWQAYLFWTINIKPKRINPSLAFDLYPLLRTEDWLERLDHSVYRETRAQELTEALWAYPQSPWHHRINMLGERGVGGVTQAAWVRSLIATYIRFDRKNKAGGLFGAPIGENQPTLPWNRTQQSAFLIFVWQCMKEAVDRSDAEWAMVLREEGPSKEDEAFLGQTSLLNTDQGVRAVLAITNDFTFARAQLLSLAEWTEEPVDDAMDEQAIETSLSSLKQLPVAELLRELTEAMAAFDWRTSAAPRLTEDQRSLKAGFRGTGGYGELARQVLRMISEQQGPVAETAKTLLSTS